MRWIRPMMTIATVMVKTIIRTNFSHYMVLFHENIFQRTNLLFIVVQYNSLSETMIYF